jgi:hypothetical protein
MPTVESDILPFFANDLIFLMCLLSPDLYNFISGVSLISVIALVAEYVKPVKETYLSFLISEIPCTLKVHI